MTALPKPEPAQGASLNARLTAELRPEFASPVILVDPSDPVMGGPVCAVQVCERVAVLTDMCSAHHQQWVDAGRPEAKQWAAAAPPLRRWLAEPVKCAVDSCRRAYCEFRLCHSHAVRWQRDGRPDRPRWIGEGGGGPALPPMPVCRFPCCGLDSEGSAGLCQVHRCRWIRNGRPPVEAWLADCAMFGRDRFDLRALPMPMRLEIAYAIQRRVEARRTKTRPEQVRRLLRKLPASGMSSLLEWTPAEWNAYLGFSSERGSVERRFLLDAIGYLRDLTDGVGWDTEYPRDVWLLRRLGYPGRDAALRFDLIEPTWLRALTKRWTRWRLSTGTVLSTVVADVRAITRFAQSFPSLLRGPEALTRELIEAHLAHLAVRYPNPKSRTGQIGSLAGLLRASRQHGWEPRLAPRVDIYHEDYPRLLAGQPRALSEAVMTQLEREQNLARFTDPKGRLLIRILMATGLRVGDGCRLQLDCIVRDGQGAPYLKYTNHKMSREAFVPIDTELADAITGQQQQVIAQFDDATYLLPRRLRNLDGRLPFSDGTFRGQLRQWLLVCDIRDELGRPVRVTPHQWRHTFGTRLINNEVPQETVRRLLDHDSHEMTGHYARLSDKTIRDQWERARKVNIAGEPLAGDTGPLADAAWMKNNLSRAKMALPNGYCTLPLQKHCEYANACLSCPMFVTTAEFLPQHHRQLAQTRELIEQAEHRGHQRLVEMNRTVETNLLAIITGLGEDGCSATTCSTSCTCTIDASDPQSTKAGADVG
ncbi:MAG TPA: tyrosine-type recombinase/integrase [Mycobacterium sp.]